MNILQAIAVVDTRIGQVMFHYGCDVCISLNREFPPEATAELTQWRGVRDVLIAALPDGIVAPTNPVDYWSHWQSSEAA